VSIDKTKYKQTNSNAQILQNVVNMEAAEEFGVTFSDFHGDQTARQCGSLSGEILKKMKEAYNNEHSNKF